MISSYFLCTSWLIPPLLGFAYVVLGGILPRAISILISQGKSESVVVSQSNLNSSQDFLQTRALQAVLSTTLIIRLSEILQTNSFTSPFEYMSHDVMNLAIMIVAACMQWLLLDSSIGSLIAASITAIGGPLSELPFVASGCWHYIPEASDYFPLQSFSDSFPIEMLQGIFHIDHLSEIALSSITGPCYFAVTMDAIALGRWFDSSADEKN